MEYSNVFVCLMGLGTVFFGLICLILMTMLLGRVCGRKKTLPATAPADVPNREELAAAISAAVAEDLGTDITGIRILSIKQV